MNRPAWLPISLPHFVGLLVALLILEFSTNTSTAAGGSDTFVYFGTYTGKKSKGIYVSRFDTATGTLGTPELAAESSSPSFLAVHPKGRYLYSVNESDKF